MQQPGLPMPRIRRPFQPARRQRIADWSRDCCAIRSKPTPVDTGIGRVRSGARSPFQQISKGGQRCWPLCRLATPYLRLAWRNGRAMAWHIVRGFERQGALELVFWHELSFPARRHHRAGWLNAEWCAARPRDEADFGWTPEVRVGTQRDGLRPSWHLDCRSRPYAHSAQSGRTRGVER